MLISPLKIFLAIFLCVLASSAQTTGLPSRFQSWNEVQLIVPVKQSKEKTGRKIDLITATFNGVMRVGRSNLDVVDDRLGAALDFRVNKHLSIFTGIVYRRDEAVIKVPRFETRLDVGVIYSKTWRNFTFRDRNMFERRFRNSRNDLNIYRQRIQVSHPLRWHDQEIFSPFISEEGYYDLHRRLWITNEFFAGITRRLNPRTFIDLAYVRSDTQPTNVNGFSVNLRIKVR